MRPVNDNNNNTITLTLSFYKNDDTSQNCLETANTIYKGLSTFKIMRSLLPINTFQVNFCDNYLCGVVYPILNNKILLNSLNNLLIIDDNGTIILHNNFYFKLLACQNDFIFVYNDEANTLCKYNTHLDLIEFKHINISNIIRLCVSDTYLYMASLKEDYMKIIIDVYDLNLDFKCRIPQIETYLLSFYELDMNMYARNNVLYVYMATINGKVVAIFDEFDFELIAIYPAPKHFSYFFVDNDNLIISLSVEEKRLYYYMYKEGFLNIGNQSIEHLGFSDTFCVTNDGNLVIGNSQTLIFYIV